MNSAGCLGKFTYLTYDHAKFDLRGIRMKADRDDWSQMKIYRCRDCHNWHIGSSTFRKGRRPSPRRVHLMGEVV